MKLRRLARPTRMRAAIHRRWFEWQMSRVPLESYEPLVRLGSEWGGWAVPDDLIDETWICYCVGAGSDVSFDLALIARYGALVRCVDPGPEFRKQAEAEADGEDRFSFHEVALSFRDGPLEMFGAENPGSGSLSAVNLYGTQRLVTMPGRTLQSLMAAEGDERVDLLKLDIEGSEYDVLGSLDLSSLGVRVLCVELHASEPVHDALRLIERLRSQGYLPVRCHEPATFTFVRSG